MGYCLKFVPAVAGNRSSSGSIVGEFNPTFFVHFEEPLRVVAGFAWNITAELQSSCLKAAEMKRCCACHGSERIPSRKYRRPTASVSPWIANAPA